jgi:hypothetical protein
MLSLQEYEKVLADLTAQKQEIEALRARNLDEESQRIDAFMGHIQAKIGQFQAPPLASSNGHTAQSHIYSGAKSLGDLSEACLASVDEAWLSPKEIADKLVMARVATKVQASPGYVSTALRRRMKSPSPDKKIEFDQGRFRCVRVNRK